MFAIGLALIQMRIYRETDGVHEMVHPSVGVLGCGQDPRLDETVCETLAGSYFQMKAW